MRDVPRSLDATAVRNAALRDLAKREPGFRPTTVIDVGANVGQSVGDFRAAYPDARIFAVEPVRAAFDRLVAAFDSDTNVHPVRGALSVASGEMRMLAKGDSTTNRILSAHEGRVGEVETVPAWS